MRAVLMLHSIDASGSAISLTPGELRGLVSGVLRSGHAIVSLRDLLEGRERDAIALTFDDGVASLAEIAAPLLSEQGVAATLFLTTGYVGRDNQWPSQPASAPCFPMLSWDGVESLHAAGWPIEAHTKTHADLRTLSPDALAEELDAPKQEIAQRLGRQPRAFAYPYGLLDARVVQAVGERYACAVTTRMAALPSDSPDSRSATGEHETTNSSHASSDPLRVPRLDAYYLRHPALQRLPGGFGGPPFRGLMALRGALRRWRGHPGEHA